jgi:hypothetical protein
VVRIGQDLEYLENAKEDEMEKMNRIRRDRGFALKGQCNSVEGELRKWRLRKKREGIERQKKSSWEWLFESNGLER